MNESKNVTTFEEMKEDKIIKEIEDIRDRLNKFKLDDMVF